MSLALLTPNSGIFDAGLPLIVSWSDADTTPAISLSTNDGGSYTLVDPNGPTYTALAEPDTISFVPGNIDARFCRIQLDDGVETVEGDPFQLRVKRSTRGTRLARRVWRRSTHTRKRVKTLEVWSERRATQLATNLRDVIWDDASEGREQSSGELETERRVFKIPRLDLLVPMRVSYYLYDTSTGDWWSVRNVDDESSGLFWHCYCERVDRDF